MYEIDETSEKVLKFFYEKWWENYNLGFIADTVQEELNEFSINQIKIKIMELFPLIMPKIENPNRFHISELGINIYEEKNYEECKEKIIERENILEQLDSLFQKDVDQKMTNVELEQFFTNKDKMHILSQMIYLQNSNYVTLDLTLGAFRTKLTIFGHQYIEKQE